VGAADGCQLGQLGDMELLIAQILLNDQGNPFNEIPLPAFFRKIRIHFSY
jgi:hypothetical protein